MKIVVIALAAILVFVGAIFARTNQSNEPTFESFETQEVLSDSSETPESSDITPSPTPTSAPTPAPTQTQTPLTDIGQFRYPESFIVSSTGTTLSLISSEDTDKITDWYKEKIKNQGMNVKAFVVTKTNDNVLNTLVGADGKREIRVEIKKNSEEQTVRILITVK